MWPLWIILLEQRVVIPGGHRAPFGLALNLPPLVKWQLALVLAEGSPKPLSFKGGLGSPALIHPNIFRLPPCSASHELQ